MGRRAFVETHLSPDAAAGQIAQILARTSRRARYWHSAVSEGRGPGHAVVVSSLTRFKPIGAQREAAGLPDGVHFSKVMYGTATALPLHRAVATSLDRTSPASLAAFYGAIQKPLTRPAARCYFAFLQRSRPTVVSRKHIGPSETVTSRFFTDGPVSLN